MALKFLVNQYWGAEQLNKLLKKGGSVEATNKPVCKLVGEYGNVFNIIGLVRDCLRKNGQSVQAREFVSKAFSAGSYDEVLRLAMTYVEVE